jgi:hypothetical protein
VQRYQIRIKLSNARWELPFSFWFIYAFKIHKNILVASRITSIPAIVLQIVPRSKLLFVLPFLRTHFLIASRYMIMSIYITEVDNMSNTPKWIIIWDRGSCTVYVTDWIATYYSMPNTTEVDKWELDNVLCKVIIKIGCIILFLKRDLYCWFALVFCHEKSRDFSHSTRFPASSYIRVKGGATADCI